MLRFQLIAAIAPVLIQNRPTRISLDRHGINCVIGSLPNTCGAAAFRDELSAG